MNFYKNHFGMLIPLTDISFAIGRKLNFKPETMPHILLENFVATLFFNTTATCVLAAVNVFGNAEMVSPLSSRFPGLLSPDSPWEAWLRHGFPTFFPLPWLAFL